MGIVGTAATTVTMAAAIVTVAGVTVAMDFETLQQSLASSNGSKKSFLFKI